MKEELWVNKFQTLSLKDSALIIAIGTVWAYVETFFYVLGYCFALKISEEFYTYNYSDMVYSGFIVIMFSTWILFLIHHAVNGFDGKFHDTTKKFLWIILILGVSYFAPMGFGYLRASMMRTFIVVEQKPKLVMWYKSGDKLYCEKYDEIHKKLTGEMMLINITDSIVMKREYLGDIISTRQ